MVRWLAWGLLASAALSLLAAVASSETYKGWRHRRRIAELLDRHASTVNFDEGASRL
jgi:hypothetical protein